MQANRVSWLIPFALMPSYNIDAFCNTKQAGCIILLSLEFPGTRLRQAWQGQKGVLAWPSAYTILLERINLPLQLVSCAA